MCIRDSINSDKAIDEYFCASSNVPLSSSHRIPIVPSKHVQIKSPFCTEHFPFDEQSSSLHSSALFDILEADSFALSPSSIDFSFASEALSNEAIPDPMMNK
eukprot:TRINITY_DN16795_c0_g1_i1.p2 TRINITY_DN16795_c0_g1~~TRINITY_DN16795_c0_g1_i1.p2  ORF type:complete len:102 (+),score=0.82 TRINITY_DN16795_c0_g1_i1:65-370(+)